MKPHRLITIAAALMLSMAFCSCKVVRASLPDRESLRTLQPLLLRSEKVDSCLEVLRGIDTTLLTRPSDKAKYALLHAMALDKNDIDTTNLSVIAPAFDYYSKWYYPRRSDKFYTWYYKARIEENAKDYDASLHSYLEAERLMGATNDLYRTRLYFGFERVYMETLSFQRGFESAQKALRYAELSNDNYNCSVALLDCASTASVVLNHTTANKYIEIYEGKYGGGLSHNNSHYYYAKMRCYEMRESMRDSSRLYLYKYVESGGAEEDIVSCLMNCMLREDYEYGEKLLKQYGDSIPATGLTASSLYNFISIINERKGDYSTALSNMRKSVELLDNTYSYSVYNDISSQAEKYHGKLQKAKLLSVLLCVIILALSVVFWYVSLLRKRKYQNMLLNQEYETISAQYRILNDALWGKDYVSDDIIKVKDRIEGIGSSLSSRGNIDFSTLSAMIVDKLGQEKYVEIISLLTAIHCKNFHRILINRGLDNMETTICSLFLIGLSTKEISFILKRNGIRNDCSEIRKKLGISKDSGYLSDELKRIYLQVKQK